MKIIKHIEPPVQDKLKAHYFDRYRPSFDGNKVLSSVGDQSEGREIQPGRCYDFDGVDDYIAITSPDVGTLYVSGLGSDGELNTTLTIGYFGNQYQISGSGKIWNIKVWTSNTATETQKKSYTLESGLFAWYKCDESTGINTYDSSGNSRHGIIINASESIHSTQPIYSWQNEVGYSIDSNFYIPRDESNPSKDVLGDDLEYKGQVAYNALAKQSNCLYLDGIDDIIQFADTTGWDRLENAGTSELSINGNNIEGTEGSVYSLRVYDGSDNLIHLFPCSEGGGTRINCVLGGTIGTLVNATLETVWGKQDEYHFNLEHGWSSGKGFSIRSNDTPVVSDSYYRFISQEGISYHFVYSDDGNPDTGRFDPDDYPLGYNNGQYFNFYRQYIVGATGGNIVFSLSSAFLSNTLTIDVEMFAGDGISIQTYDGTLEEAFRQELNNRYGVGVSTSAVFQTVEMFYLALSGTDETYGENYPETIGFPVGVTSADLRQVMTDVGVSDVPFFLSEYGKFGGTGGASASWWIYGLVREYTQRIYRLDLDGRTKIEIRNADALATGSRSNLSGDYFKVTDRLMERFGTFTIRSLSNGLWAHFYQVSINENHRTPASLTNHNQDATGLKLENVAGRYHNGAETLIDFTGGIESPYAVQFELPNNYAFGDPIEYKEEANNIEKNILIYEGVDSGEDIRIKNFVKDI